MTNVRKRAVPRSSATGTLVLHIAGPILGRGFARVNARIDGVRVPLIYGANRIKLRPGPHTVEIRRGRWKNGGYAEAGFNLGERELLPLSYQCRPLPTQRHHIHRAR